MMWGKPASFAILSYGAALYLSIYTRCGGHDSVAAASVGGEHRPVIQTSIVSDGGAWRLYGRALKNILRDASLSE